MTRSSPALLHRGIALLATVFLLLSAGSMNAADAAPLRWKFHSGEKLRWTLMQHVGLKGPSNGVTKAAEIQTGMEFEITVLDASEDRTRLRIRTIAVTGAMKSPETNFEYDSRTFDPDAIPKNDEEELLLETLLAVAAGSEPLLNYELTCMIGSRGVVSDVQVDPELAASFTGPAESSRPLLEPAGLNSVFFGALVPMPESSPANATWSETIVSPRRFGVHEFLMHFELAYAGDVIHRDRPQAKFSITPRMEFKADKKSPAAAFLSVEVKPGTSTGVLYFDRALGRVTHCEWESNNVVGFSISKDQEPLEGEFNLRTTSDVETLK